MVKNMFEDMEVFDQEQKNSVTITQERFTKKEQRVKETQLRQAFGDRASKPTGINQLGSRTIKSDKDDRKPHSGKSANRKHTQSGGLKKGQQAAENEVEITENGMEIEEGVTAPQEPITTLDEYFQKQGVNVPTDQTKN